MENIFIIDDCTMYLCMQLDEVKELVEQLKLAKTEEDENVIMDKIEDVIKKEFGVEHIMYGESI